MDHHYLPQFYLRGWADGDGKVLRYDFRHGRLIESRVSPRSTSFEPDLYAAPPAVFWETYDPQIIETEFFGKIDNEAARVLERLVGPAPAPNEEDREAWARFVVSLAHRHGDDVRLRDAEAPVLAARSLDKMLARCQSLEQRESMLAALEGFDIVRSARNAHRTMMVQAIRAPEATKPMLALAWEVVPVGDAPLLITTDRPALVGRDAQGGIGLLTMPITPTKLLFGYPAYWRNPDGSFAEGLSELRPRLVGFHNLFLLNQAPCRTIYSVAPLEDDAVLGDKIIHLRTATAQVLAVRAGRVTSVPEG